MAEKNATGANENIDHQGRKALEQDSEKRSQENNRTEVKNAHASGLGALERSEESNLPHQDRAPGEKEQEY